MRSRPLAERLAWARWVDSSVVDRVLAFHDLCLARRRVLELEAYDGLGGCEQAAERELVDV